MKPLSLLASVALLLAGASCVAPPSPVPAAPTTLILPDADAATVSLAERERVRREDALAEARARIEAGRQLTE